MELAFYTVFFGSNQNVACRIPPLPSEKYDCYYYTNNSNIYNKLADTKWKRIFINKPTTDDQIESCLAAKEVKVKPHIFLELEKYDFTCYLDTKLRKLSIPLIEDLILKYMINNTYAFLLRKHWFIEDSIWREYEESFKQHRYCLEKTRYHSYITKNIESGLAAITPYHCACGLIIRRMNHSKIKELNETWYDHILQCGIQDQISFFFVKQLFYDVVHAFTEDPFV